MRRVIVAAAVVSVALAGATGCGDHGNQTSANAGSASTTAADAAQTKQACQEAIATSTSAFAEFQSKYEDFMTAATSGDLSKLDSFEADFDKLGSAWKAKLTDLAAKPIDPKVKSVLTNGIAAVDMITSEDTELTANQVQANLKDFATKLAAACA